MEEDWRNRFKFTVGWVDFSEAVTWAQTKAAVNEMNTAEVHLDLDQSVLDRLDFTARVIIESFDDAGEPHIMFAGRIADVRHGDDIATITCSGAMEMQLTPGGVLTYRDCSIDLFETLLYDSGLPHEPRIEGDLRPVEVFEIVAPCTQVTTSGPTNFGTVSIVTADSVLDLLGKGSDVPEQFLDQVKGHSAFLRTFVQTRRMYDAQREAERRFDEALARLIVASRYSSFRLPDGQTYPWDRRQTRFDPERVPIISMLGCSTGRFYVRRTGLRSYGFPMNVEERPLADYSTADLPIHDLATRQAYVLCARAARVGERIDQVTYLWQSLEFLLGGVAVGGEIFPRGKLREIRRLRREHLRGLTDEQAVRFDDLIGHLNDPPLLAKLRKLVSEVGVPLEDREMDTLVKLRRFRNDVNHGREPELPKVEEVELGVAIVARILTYFSTRSGK